MREYLTAFAEVIYRYRGSNLPLFILKGSVYTAFSLGSERVLLYLGGRNVPLKYGSKVPLFNRFVIKTGAKVEHFFKSVIEPKQYRKEPLIKKLCQRTGFWKCTKVVQKWYSFLKCVQPAELQPVDKSGQKKQTVDRLSSSYRISFYSSSLLPVLLPAGLYGLPYRLM